MPIISVDGVEQTITDEELAVYTYVPPATAAQVRGERDNILVTVVDPLVSNNLRWADLTSDKQAEWSQYRTDLLAVPQQAGFPNNITWPQEPSA